MTIKTKFNPYRRTTTVSLRGKKIGTICQYGERVEYFPNGSNAPAFTGNTVEAVVAQIEAVTV